MAVGAYASFTLQDSFACKRSGWLVGGQAGSVALAPSDRPIASTCTAPYLHVKKPQIQGQIGVDLWTSNEQNRRQYCGGHVPDVPGVPSTGPLDSIREVITHDRGACWLSDPRRQTQSLEDRKPMCAPHCCGSYTNPGPTSEFSLCESLVACVLLIFISGVSRFVL